MTNETHNTKPRRRWYQFSLRTLLIVVTLSTVPLGWVGWKLEQGRRERAVIAWIENMGGIVGFEEVEEKSWWNQFSDKWFGRSVRLVVLYDTPTNDLSPLAELKNLEVLNLNNTQVSDLSPLAALKNLKELELQNTPVTDLSPLAELESLKELYLQNTQVSDLSPLAELESLEELHINNTQVSDLSPLAELRNLRYISLKITQVTDEQVRKLQQALPNCNISAP